MAVLKETLGTAKSPAANYSYKYPRISSPYTESYGARVNYGQQSQNSQGLFAALAQSQQQQQSARAVPSAQYQTNYDFDPVLSRIAAMSEMSIANARSEAANLKKKALIDAGSPDIAQGVGADANTIEAAKQNPFSTEALLNRDFAQRGRELDEAMNQGNLFYSGERQRQLEEQSFGRAQADTDFGAKLRMLLSGIDEQLLAAEAAERQRLLEAALAAAAKAKGTVPGGPPGAQPRTTTTMQGLPANTGVSTPGIGSPEPVDSGFLVDSEPQAYLWPDGTVRDYPPPSSTLGLFSRFDQT